MNHDTSPKDEPKQNRFERRRARSMRRRGLDPTDPQQDPRTPTVPLVALMARLRPLYFPPRPVQTDEQKGRALLAAEIKCEMRRAKRGGTYDRWAYLAMRGGE